MTTRFRDPSMKQGDERRRHGIPYRPDSNGGAVMTDLERIEYLERIIEESPNTPKARIAAWLIDEIREHTINWDSDIVLERAKAQ
jgi:hypothetical protein